MRDIRLHNPDDNPKTGSDGCDARMQRAMRIPTGTIQAQKYLTAVAELATARSKIRKRLTRALDIIVTCRPLVDAPVSDVPYDQDCNVNSALTVGLLAENTVYVRETLVDDVASYEKIFQKAQAVFARTAEIVPMKGGRRSKRRLGGSFEERRTNAMLRAGFR